MSVQEKYNQIIYDACDEETLRSLSHLRSNVFAPVMIKPEDEILLLSDGEAALTEYFKERGRGVYTEADKDKKYQLIIMTKALRATPSQLKEMLMAGGTLGFAADNREFDKNIAVALFEEAGFKEIDIYIAKPGYEFATEIILEGYKKEESDGYLIIAKN